MIDIDAMIRKEIENGYDVPYGDGSGGALCLFPDFC